MKVIKLPSRITKGYFPVPALMHISGECLKLMRELLSPERAQKRGIFNYDYVAMLLAEPDKHLTPLGRSKLWQLGLLELWLETNSL